MANNPNAKANLSGFELNPQNINRKGRPMSFKNEFKKLLESNGLLTIPKDNIVSINKDGSIKIKVPKKDMMVMKALNWAMSNKGAESTKMIQWIIEMFDGKATQKVEAKTLNVNINPLDERLKELGLY